MANYDHADNIGTHPAYSKDPETRLRARFEAAQNQAHAANRRYVEARQALRDFLASKAEPEEVI